MERILLDKAGRNDDARQFLAFVYPLSVGKRKLVVTLDHDVKTRRPFTGKKEYLTLSIVSINMITETDRQVDGLLYRYETIWEKPQNPLPDSDKIIHDAVTQP